MICWTSVLKIVVTMNCKRSVFIQRYHLRYCAYQTVQHVLHSLLAIVGIEEREAARIMRQYPRSGQTTWHNSTYPMKSPEAVLSANLAMM